MIELVGYLAAALVLCTFCTKTMVPLRVFAIASNTAFIAYAVLLEICPIFILHAILLPLNLWRLWQILRRGRLVRDGAGESMVFAALAPFARRFTVRAGEVVIRKGDRSDALYLVVEGTVHVVEAEAALGAGAVVGEMGVLSSTQARTATVVAIGDCVLGRVCARDFRRIYSANPALGLRLVRLIIDRLSTEVEARRLGASLGLAAMSTK